ncbi:hypothetical protein C8R47DRAFT_1143383 [Mycena vitilis]|nr:hypothetical protein C8R47DRAFT_1143383 [Mycena vitilis]
MFSTILCSSKHQPSASLHRNLNGIPSLSESAGSKEPVQDFTQITQLMFERCTLIPTSCPLRRCNFSHLWTLALTSMRASGSLIWLITTFICFCVPVLCAHAIGDRDSLSDSGLASASWIWTAQATTGNVAFLKTFTSAAGKSAASASISMTAVNHFTLFANGQPIGASGNGTDDWKTAKVLSAALNSSSNTFAVLAVNNDNLGAPLPGLLAAIQVTHSDGSTESVVSDASWLVSSTIPTQFPTVSATSHFVPATVAGPFGSGSWGSSPAILSPTPTSLLAGITQIWDSSSAGSDAPAGTVGFRKIVSTPAGKIAESAQILIAVDSGFLLYVNDVYIGAPPPAPIVPNYRRAQQVTVDLSAGSNSFTVFGQNIPDPGSTDAGPAGLAASITIQYSDRSNTVVVTDTDWLCGNFTTVTAFLSQGDSELSQAFAIQTIQAGQLNGPSDILAAPKVPSGPFAVGTVPLSSSSTLPSSTASSSPGAVASSAHGTPIGVIIGPVLGALALVAIVLALFFWRRRRLQSRERFLSSEPFKPESDPSQPGDEPVWPTEMGSAPSSYTPNSTSYSSPWTSRGASAQPPPGAYLSPPPVAQTVVPRPSGLGAQTVAALPGAKIERERNWQQTAASNPGSAIASHRTPTEVGTIAPPSYTE